VSISTQELYNRSSGDWTRNEPVLLSDYTARPFLLDWCSPVAGKDILDLGCGEGYFARNLKKRGAGTIHAMDISEEMVSRAAQQEEANPMGIAYSTGNANDLGRFSDASFDLVVAVFLFNYLTTQESLETMTEVFRVLRPGGRFVFSVPHPSLAFIREEEPPFYFSRGGAGYFSGRNRLFEGKIWRRDGQGVAVRCVHKTVEDYFTCLKSAGYKTMPEVKELGVDDEMIKIDPRFFTPLNEQPLHMAISVEK